MGLAAAGCMPAGDVGPGQGSGVETGEGPGRRQQSLALTPEEELRLGRQAYREILSKARVVRGGRDVDRVREIGQRIAKAAEIEPLQREINLRLKGHIFEWEFNVLEDRQVNAFCLPGGKVAVYTGLIRLAENDDQLATVMAHEVAHALAHHASERLSRRQMLREARLAADQGLESVDESKRELMVGLMAAGSGRRGLAHDRFQENEADHIGIFLMTFAGYQPEAAVRFWQRMAQQGRGRETPEILSDHPSDERRIAHMQMWVPHAKAAKKAFDEGRIAPRR